MNHVTVEAFDQRREANLTKLQRQRQDGSCLPQQVRRTNAFFAKHGLFRLTTAQTLAVQSSRR